MKLVAATCIAFLSCNAASMHLHAAEATPPAEHGLLQTPFTEERTYYREHRLRAYDRTRAAVSQGATCVTPKMVCWIGEAVPDGDACSCETRRFGVVKGIVGG
jgi:hypothetical protein